ncbi:MAG TPA: tetratricopeptide repeat-containing glycosyltransferase family protein [Tepidisphaeraceae bacterium]|nr:tetratricopeptide repeat-containing glycosyltransferase family protein [Tepidisphaeraceae bacterium]
MTQFTVQQAIDLAQEHQRAQRPAEAEAIYRQILAQAPARHDVYQRLAEICYQSGRVPEALELMRGAVAADPNVADYHGNLAMLLSTLGQFDEAIPAFQRALSIRPSSAETLNNLGGAMRETARYDQAAAALRRALAIRPDYAEAEWNLAFVLLAQGNLGEGLPAFEARLRVKNFPNRRIQGPMWDGSDLHGRRILLHTEQGVGDTFNFIRYAPLVAARGGRVFVLCSPDVHRLMSVQELSVEQWIADGQPRPEFDTHCPLMSLPKVFGTTMETIPAGVPYMAADPKWVEPWRKRLAQDSAVLKVGLVWAGNMHPIHNRKRTMALATLLPLGALPRVSFYSLQKGAAALEAKTPPAGMRLIDWSDELNDFADTAALIAALDLIITVDTSVAHLAAAMGKPTWVLLPFVADWRWFMDREDSPWYPTMRLFRQTALGDWRGPVARVAEELGRMRMTKLE